MRTATLALTALLALASPALADEGDAPWRPQSHLGVSPMGLAGFLRLNVGSYELSFEHVIERHHGLRVAGDFIHVHQAAAHLGTHQWTFGGSLGYRYYVEPDAGAFVGVLAGYRRGFGHWHEPESGRVTLGNEQLRVLAEVGYRFLLRELSLSIAPRLALGYGEVRVWADDAGQPDAARAALASRDVLAPAPIVIDLALELAFAF